MTQDNKRIEELEQRVWVQMAKDLEDELKCKCGHFGSPDDPCECVNNGDER